MKGKWTGLAGLFDAAAPKLGGPNAVPVPRPAPDFVPSTRMRYDMEPQEVLKPYDDSYLDAPFSPTMKQLGYDTPKYLDSSEMSRLNRPTPGSYDDSYLDAPGEFRTDYKRKRAPKPQKTSYLGRVASGEVANRNVSLLRGNYAQKKPAANRPAPLSKTPPKETPESYDDSYLDAPGEFKTDYKRKRAPKPQKTSYLGRVASGTVSNFDLVRSKGKYSTKKPAPMPIRPSDPVPDTYTPAMGFGSANAVVGGALVGGGTAWIGSTEENRGVWTFAKGATFGAAGGAVVSGVASRGMISGVAEWGQAVSKNFDFGTEFAGKAVQTARGIESAEARAALFATGAMLGGGMFGTNRNRAQGLNSTRGNRFGG